MLFVATDRLQDEIRALAEPTLTRLGLDLVAVEVTADQIGPVVRLSLERPGGVTIADCTSASHHLSPILDATDPVEGAYRLEVSSPGIDRPVQRLSDFERFVGCRIKLRLFEGFSRRRYSGDIAGVEGKEITLLVDGQEHTVHFDDVERTKLVLDLEQFQALKQGANNSQEHSDDNQ